MPFYFFFCTLFFLVVVFPTGVGKFSASSGLRMPAMSSLASGDGGGGGGRRGKGAETSLLISSCKFPETCGFREFAKGLHKLNQPLSMFLLLITLFQLYACIFWINFYSLVFIILVYGLWYFDGKEYTGERRWDAFRTLRIWKWLSPLDYTFTNKLDLNLTNAAVKRLYVLIPGDTYISLIWGIGLHGGELSPFASRMHYIVPPIFMWIPLLRDVLLWSGAVTFHSKKRPLDSILLELLQSNRSVCYCPSDFSNVVEPKVDVEHGVPKDYYTIKTPCPSEDMFSFARQEQLQLVPIVTHGERKRYYVMELPRVQEFFYRLIGYPFPLIFCLRIFNKTRPPLLHQQFGPIIECNAKYESNEQLRESFVNCVEALRCVELGDDEFKLM